MAIPGYFCNAIGACTFMFCKRTRDSAIRRGNGLGRYRLLTTRCSPVFWSTPHSLFSLVRFSSFYLLSFSLSRTRAPSFPSSLHHKTIGFQSRWPSFNRRIFSLWTLHVSASTLFSTLRSSTCFQSLPCILIQGRLALFSRPPSI